MPPERQKPDIPDVKKNPQKGNPLSFLKHPLAKQENPIPAYETGTPTNPGISSSNNADTKPNVFAITKTPVRIPETPSKDRGGTVPVPTKKEVKAANAGEYAPRGITRIMLDTAKNHPVGTGLAAAAALTAAAYAMPAIHEEVNSNVADWWKSIGDFSRAPTFEERFPIVLPKEGFTPITKDEEQELWKNTKTVDLENHTFTIGFPVDQATIDKSPNLRMSKEFDVLLPPIEKNKLEQEGVKNLDTVSGLPNGAEYRVIYDDAQFDVSVILLAVANVTQGESSNSFTPAYTNYRLLFKDKETGVISLQGGVSGLLAKPLISTKPYPKNIHPVYEDGTPIKSGASIMKLTTDLQDWDGKTGQLLPGQKGQFQASVSYEQQSPYDSRIMLGLPLTTNFLKAPDGNIAPRQ